MRVAMLVAAAALILAVPAQAKLPYVKKAQELGFADVKNCTACHEGAPKKDGAMSERGKFLKKLKADKKAAEVDLNWLKEYKGK
jgi:Skp family chaperone for outer membrane proteins